MCKAVPALRPAAAQGTNLKQVREVSLLTLRKNRAPLSTCGMCRLRPPLQCMVSIRLTFVAVRRQYLRCRLTARESSNQWPVPVDRHEFTQSRQVAEVLSTFPVTM